MTYLHNKKTFLVVLSFLAAALLLTNAVPASDKQSAGANTAIHFNWAFGAWVQTGSNRELISVDRDMSLKTGDRLKFFLQPLSTCHIYLIYHGSRDEIHQLFPAGGRAALQDQDLQIPQLIPAGSGWFSIDSHPGLERFYLLASEEPLKDLEALLLRVKGAPSEDRPEMAREIRAEIKRLKRSHRQLRAAAERPVAIGGTVRGTTEENPDANPDVRQLAHEISTTSFFNRTFTIEHE